ncbi:hypothetical protein [Asaia sp. VD9]|uniref:hypothetical protein n=1 Tax=Asaia sp. VD9 TaxID=3081235 RepID=UPI00301B3063
MTHEQKPGGVEFRTLETQVSECARDLHASLIALEEKLYAEFAEAEDRGAAEQRRKDAEGAGIAGYIPADTPNFFAISEAKYASTAMHRKPFPNDVPVYYRPANVAALEARVKELEEENERLKKPEWVCDEETSYADVHDALSQRDDPILEITKFTACRSVRDIWAFLDEKFVVHEFATGIEAKNAAAAIREGGEHG